MKRHYWGIPFSACGWFFLISGPVDAASAKVNITGIYSDLYYNREGGDLLGTEVFIVVSSEHANGQPFVAFVQNWQGGTALPVVVPVDVRGNAVSFTVPAPSLGEGEYKGRITKNGFDGTWRHPLTGGGDAEEPIHLKRKNSYWQ